MPPLPYMNRLLALLASLIKNLPGTNTLAYFAYYSSCPCLLLRSYTQLPINLTGTNALAYFAKVVEHLLNSYILLSCEKYPGTKTPAYCAYCMDHLDTLGF